MNRVLFLLLLCILIPLVPWWVYGLGAAAYCYRFVGYELFILGACIDAYYGAGTSVPVYTAVTIVAFFVAEYARPYLSV